MSTKWWNSGNVVLVVVFFLILASNINILLNIGFELWNTNKDYLHRCRPCILIKRYFVLMLVGVV